MARPVVARPHQTSSKDWSDHFVAGCRHGRIGPAIVDRWKIGRSLTGASKRGTEGHSQGRAPQSIRGLGAKPDTDVGVGFQTGPRERVSVLAPRLF